MLHWKTISTSAATLAARLSSTAAILVANGVAHRRMTLEQYGLWTMLYLINLFTNGLDLGFQFTLGNRLAALASRGDEAEEERRETFLSIFFLQIFIFLADSLVILLAVPYVPWARWFKITSPAFAAEVARMMPGLLIIMVGTLPVGLIWTAFFAYREIRLASSLTGICNLVQTALFVAVVVGSSFWTVLLAYFSFNIVAGIALTVYLFIRRRWRFTFIPPARMFAIVRSMARVSFHAFFLTISATVSQILGPIVSGAVSGLVAAGDYNNIQRLFSFLATSHLAILAPIGPTNTLEASAGNWDAVRRRLRVCVLQLWPAFFILAGGALWCIHPFVIRLWLGYTFRNYNLAALLLAWAALCAFVNTFSAFLNNLGLVKVQAVASFCMILPSILVPIFLGRWFGIPGIALGQVLCVLPAAVIWPIYTRRALRLQMLRV